MHTKIELRALCAGALVGTLTLWACSKGGPSAPEEPGTTTPQIGVSTTALAFGPTQEERPLTLTNRGSVPIDWRSETSAAWLAVTPASGSLPAGEVTVAVKVARQGLAAGNHDGQLRIVAGETSIPVAVTAHVEARPIASLDPTSFDLGTNGASASANLSNVGNAPLTWSVSGPAWVGIAPASGTLAAGAAQAIVLTPNRSALSPGAHQADLTLTSNGGTASIVLRATVAPPPASLRTAPATLDFGTSTGALTATIANDGGQALTWSASTGASWVGLSRGGGTVDPGSSQAISVSVDRQGLATGTHSTTLRVLSNGGEVSIAIQAVVEATAPPPPPPPSSIALAGQIVDQFNGGGLAGLTVRFDGSSAVTDASGRFAIPGTSSNTLKALAISGGTIHPRATYARGTDSRWLAIPGSFNMPAFNDMAREYEPNTIRWLANPQIYIDTRPEGFPAGPELNQWIAEVRDVAATFVSQWTNGAVTAASVTVTSSPPPDGTAGTIVIHFSEDPSRYSGPQTVGLARTSWSSRRDIVWSTIWLRFSLVSENPTARTAVTGHELGHSMGMGHMDGTTSSIMTPRVSLSSLSTFDSQSGSIVYSRSPGNTNPDSDNLSTFTGALVPSAEAVGRYEWICDAPANRSR